MGPRTATGLSASLLLALLTVTPAAGVAGEARVRLDGGLVSATFEATRAADAVQAIRRATGVELALPPSARTATLTLAVTRVPVEAFLKRALEALDLGGFALVYAPGGAADRLIVVDRARGREAAPAPAPAETTGPPAVAVGGPPPERGRRAVPVLLPAAQAASMRLGAPGQVILVHSAPVARTETAACDGVPAAYPVQTVLVIDRAATYVTSLVVCDPEGLRVGATLVPPPTRAGAPAGGDGSYSRYEATVR